VPPKKERKEGRKEGKKEGRKEGKKEGRKERRKEVMLDMANIKQRKKKNPRISFPVWTPRGCSGILGGFI
jgi:hypothetical protein